MQRWSVDVTESSALRPSSDTQAAVSEPLPSSVRASEDAIIAAAAAPTRHSTSAGVPRRLPPLAPQDKRRSPHSERLSFDIHSEPPLTAVDALQRQLSAVALSDEGGDVGGVVAASRRTSAMPRRFFPSCPGIPELEELAPPGGKEREYSSADNPGSAATAAQPRGGPAQRATEEKHDSVARVSSGDVQSSVFFATAQMPALVGGQSASPDGQTHHHGARPAAEPPAHLSSEKPGLPQDGSIAGYLRWKVCIT